MSNEEKDILIEELKLQNEKLAHMFKLLALNTTFDQDELENITEEFEEASTAEDIRKIYYRFIMYRKKYNVYEKTPAHCSAENNVILGSYDSIDEAQVAREKHGYNTDNYYIDKCKPLWFKK